MTDTQIYHRNLEKLRQSADGTKNMIELRVYNANESDGNYVTYIWMQLH